MFDRSKAKEVIDSWSDWLRRCLETRKTRLVPLKLPKDKALALIGVRRCGKSYAATYLADQPQDCFYLNFEDPFFIENASSSVLDDMISVFTEHSRKSPKILMFDEIQNVEGWERWVRKVVDLKRFKIVITGSSAKLLSQELATSLTGRCLSTTVWPLSFVEYLQFSGRECRNADEYLGALRHYMNWGGFPDVVLTDDEVEKRETLQQYLTDILYKDIIKRNDVRSARSLEQLVRYYLTNISSLHSYNSVQKAFGLNVETARDYTRFLQDAFLVFEVNRYHRNLKVQTRDAKKIYGIDTGMRNVGALSHQDDLGKQAENIVYLELRRRAKEVTYFKEAFETDFLIVERARPVEAVQVCYSDLKSPETREREVRALLECLKVTKLSEGLILTLNRDESATVEGKKIHFRPLYRWLLSQETVAGRKGDVDR